jgi:hypothetical protein
MLDRISEKKATIDISRAKLLVGLIMMLDVCQVFPSAQAEPRSNRI